MYDECIRHKFNSLPLFLYKLCILKVPFRLFLLSPYKKKLSTFLHSVLGTQYATGVCNYAQWKRILSKSETKKEEANI